MKKHLLVVVDMQNDFIGGVLGTKEAQDILPAVADRIRKAVHDGDDIFYTRDTHEKNYLSTQEGKNLPVPHCIRGSFGWQIADGIPVAGEVVDKPAFGSDELARKVKEGGYDSAELVGVCTDICVISNALLIRSLCPETEVSVRADCCAGVTPERHRVALEAMRACQIKII